jgi:phage tail sheath gpL-like
MSDLQAPLINWQIKAGKSVTGLEAHRAIIIGEVEQKTIPTPNKTLIRDIRPSDAIDLLGSQSIGYAAYRRFRKYNEVTPLDFMALSVSGTTESSKCTIPITGTANEDGVLVIHMADDEYVIRVNIAQGDTSAKVATKIEAATDASPDPISSTKDGTTKIVFDLQHARGTTVNGCHLTVQNRIAGIRVPDGIFSGGTGTFDISGALASLDQTRYHTVIYDGAFSTSEMDGYLESRFNSTGAVMGGVGVTMLLGNLSILNIVGHPMNSRCVVNLGNPDEMAVTAIPLLAAAEFGAKRALRLTDGAVLGDIVLDANEAFGGISKASLPYHNTPMSYKASKNKLTVAQAKQLTDVGMSLLVPNGQQTVLGSIVTSYKRDASGVSNKAFKYLNSVDTSLAIQEYMYNNCQKEFGQTRATGGGLVAGVSMTNALSVKSYIIGLYDDLVDMALAQGGKDAKAVFIRDLTVTLDAETGTYRVFAPIAIVSQLRGIDGIISISYNF